MAESRQEVSVQNMSVTWLQEQEETPDTSGIDSLGLDLSSGLADLSWSPSPLELDREASAINICWTEQTELDTCSL